MQVRFGATFITPKTFQVSDNDRLGYMANQMFIQREFPGNRPCELGTPNALASTVLSEAVTPGISIKVNRTLCQDPKAARKLAQEWTTYNAYGHDTYTLAIFAPGSQKPAAHVQTNMETLLNQITGPGSLVELAQKAVHVLLESQQKQS